MLATVLVCAASCRKQPDYSSCPAPVVVLMMDQMTPDLNRVDNTPVLCVIFSEAGLTGVKLFVSRSDTETLYKEYTEFRDAGQFSLEEHIAWTEDITRIRILAADRSGKSGEAVMSVSVTPLLPAPVISFEKEVIVIDEKAEDPSTVETVFTVTSSNTLASVAARLFRAGETVDIPLTPSFREGMSEYVFTQEIDYANGDRALQVTATDANGKMKIETLPVNYIPAPAPEFIPTGSTSADPLFVRGTDSGTFTFRILSDTGLSAVQAFKVRKDPQGNRSDVLMDTRYYESSADFDVNYEYTVSGFDRGSYAIRFVAIDRLNHSSEFEIPAIVDLRMKNNIIIASQYNAKSPLAVQGYEDQQAYCFFSVRDFKTYSLQYYWDEANRRNIDFFYFAWNYASSSDNGSRIMRANEDRSGQDAEGYLKLVDAENPENNIPELGTGTQWGSRNATLIKKLTSAYTFNFDNATYEDLAGPNISSFLNQAKTSADWVGLKAGDCLVFKTGPLSTCPDCVGIMKVESVTGSKTDFGKGPVYLEISIKAQIVE